MYHVAFEYEEEMNEAKMNQYCNRIKEAYKQWLTTDKAEVVVFSFWKEYDETISIMKADYRMIYLP